VLVALPHASVSGPLLAVARGSHAARGHPANSCVAEAYRTWIARRTRWGMANRPAPGVGLREGDRKRLRALTRSSTVPAGLAQRARIVLLAARRPAPALRDRVPMKSAEGAVQCYRFRIELRAVSPGSAEVMWSCPS
jgi:hypothetical protein